MLGGLLSTVSNVAGVASSVIGGGKSDVLDPNEGLKYGYSPKAWVAMGIGYRAIARGDRSGTVPGYYREGEYAYTPNVTGNAAAGSETKAGIIGGLSNTTLLIIAAGLLFVMFRN